MTTLGIQTPAPSVAKPAREVGTARWMLRELLLRVFCRLQNEAWYDVRRVHRTPWYVWVLRDDAGRTLHSSGVGRHRSRAAAAAEAERFFGGP